MVVQPTSIGFAGLSLTRSDGSFGRLRRDNPFFGGTYMPKPSMCIDIRARPCTCKVTDGKDKKTCTNMACPVNKSFLGETLSDTEKALRLLEEQVGSLKGSPCTVSKDEIWRDFIKTIEA